MSYYVLRLEDGSATVYYDEQVIKETGRPYGQFESIPDGFGLLMVDDQLTRLWWEDVPEPAPEPGSVATEIELAQQDITNLELSIIEQGQQMTDLELMILGGITNV